MITKPELEIVDIEFRSTRNNENSFIHVEQGMDNPTNLYEVIRTFESFLRQSGYDFDGRLRLDVG